MEVREEITDCVPSLIESSMRKLFKEEIKAAMKELIKSSDIQLPKPTNPNSKGKKKLFESEDDEVEDDEPEEVTVRPKRGIGKKQTQSTEISSEEENQTDGDNLKTRQKRKVRFTGVKSLERKNTSNLGGGRVQGTRERTGISARLRSRRSKDNVSEAEEEEVSQLPIRKLLRRTRAKTDDTADRCKGVGESSAVNQDWSEYPSVEEAMEFAMDFSTPTKGHGATTDYAVVPALPVSYVPGRGVQDERLSVINEDMVDGNEIANMSAGVGDQTVQLQEGQKSKYMESEGAAITIDMAVQSVQVCKDESVSHVKGSDFVSSQVEKMVVDGKGSEIAQETNKVAAATTLVAGGEDEPGKQSFVNETEATPQVAEKMADSEKPKTLTFEADDVRLSVLGKERGRGRTYQA